LSNGTLGLPRECWTYSKYPPSMKMATRPNVARAEVALFAPLRPLRPPSGRHHRIIPPIHLDLDPPGFGLARHPMVALRYE
jgi:hypothetical protein